MPVGAAIGISGVVGAGASLMGGKMQADSTAAASAQQKAMYDQTRSDLMPFQQAGQQGTNMLVQQLPDLTKPIIMDEATLRQTPGYQFNRNQGLKATQNVAAARGLGASGAALKGAAAFATGLADSTYQNQFTNAVTNQTNAYNRLMDVAKLGESAAAQTGSFGTQTAQSIGQNTIAGGTAQAAGLVGAGNALTNAGQSWAGYKWANDNPNALMPRSMYAA